MLRDEIQIQPACTVYIIDVDGVRHLVDICAGDIVTTVGKNRAASHLANLGNATEWFTHLALGTNTDAESTEDLSLGAEIYRVALDNVAGDGLTPNNIFATGETVFGHAVIQADSVAAGTVTVAEVGLLDALVGGNLICRQVLSNALTLSGTEKLDILWGVIVN